jgi:hypothetical protein
VQRFQASARAELSHLAALSEQQQQHLERSVPSLLFGQQEDRFVSAPGRALATSHPYVIAVRRKFDAELDAWISMPDRPWLLELVGPKGMGKSHALMRFAVRLWLKRLAPTGSAEEEARRVRFRVVYVPCLHENTATALKRAFCMAYWDNARALEVIERNASWGDVGDLLDGLFEVDRFPLVCILDQVFQKDGDNKDMARLVTSFEVLGCFTIAASSPHFSQQSRLGAQGVTVFTFSSLMDREEAERFLTAFASTASSDVLQKRVSVPLDVLERWRRVYSSLDAASQATASQTNIKSHVEDAVEQVVSIQRGVRSLLFPGSGAAGAAAGAVADAAAVEVSSPLPATAADATAGAAGAAVGAAAEAGVGPADAAPQLPLLDFLLMLTGGHPWQLSELFKAALAAFAAGQDLVRAVHSVATRLATKCAKPVASHLNSLDDNGRSVALCALHLTNTGNAAELRSEEMPAVDLRFTITIDFQVATMGGDLELLFLCPSLIWALGVASGVDQFAVLAGREKMAQLIQQHELTLGISANPSVRGFLMEAAAIDYLAAVGAVVLDGATFEFQTVVDDKKTLGTGTVLVVPRRWNFSLVDAYIAMAGATVVAIQITCQSLQDHAWSLRFPVDRILWITNSATVPRAPTPPAGSSPQQFWASFAELEAAVMGGRPLVPVSLGRRVGTLP